MSITGDEQNALPTDANQSNKDFADAEILTRRPPSYAAYERSARRIASLLSWLARRPVLVSLEKVASACAVALRDDASDEYEWLKRGILNGRFEVKQGTERRASVWLLSPRFACQGRLGRSPKLPDWPRLTRSMMQGFVSATAGCAEFPFAQIRRSELYTLAEMYGLHSNNKPLSAPPMEFLLSGCWTTRQLAARWMEFRRAPVPGWLVGKSDKRKRGRPPGPGKGQYDWPSFNREALRLLEDHGLPDRTVEAHWTKSVLERQMLQWSEENWGTEPAESTIRVRVNSVIEEFKKGREL